MIIVILYSLNCNRELPYVLLVYICLKNNKQKKACFTQWFCDQHYKIIYLLLTYAAV